jgi:hypothetical protein
MNVDDLREQAEAIHRDARRKIEDLRLNRQLTAEARSAQMAKEVTSSNEKLGELQRQCNDRIAQEGRTLERRLWTSPKADGDPTGEAWRAALDRADTIENFGQASALLERSERSGDVLLAKAIALRAEGRWPQVADHYAQDHPDVGSAIYALREFQRDTSGTKWRLASSMWFSKVPTPQELSGISGARLTSVARRSG